MKEPKPRPYSVSLSPPAQVTAIAIAAIDSVWSKDERTKVLRAVAAYFGYGIREGE